MEIILRKYNLPDAPLIRDLSFYYRYLLWVPPETCVVLGRGNKPEQSLFIEKVIEDGIPVYRRPTGGEAVVLSPRMLVISIAENSNSRARSKEYFDCYNGRIITALKNLGVRDLCLQGTSDIAIGERKVLGSSIYRNKNQVFYHAVLNVAEDPDLMMRYLKPPKRIPPYRGNRSHKDFVSSLSNKGYDFSLDDIKKAIALEICTPI